MNSLDRVIEELSPFLIPYLESLGIQVEGKSHINCINTEHDDSTPSMAIVPGSEGRVIHCFGCGASYSIFHAAHHLESKPLRGAEFVTDTIPYLAEKFGIEFTPENIELSPEQIELRRYRQLYEDAAATLREIGTYDHALNLKGWTEQTCRELGIATVSWDDFQTRVCNKGTYTPEELVSKGIKRTLFGSNLITFTIRNHRGLVSGFVARNVKYKPGDRSTYPKFCNTADSVPIYSKRNLLYGLNTVSRSSEERLDIFEGYGDFVTAYQSGLRNTCALGGVALTPEHVSIVKELGFQHVNIVLDGDETGRTKTRRFLDEFSGIAGLKVTAMELIFDDGYEDNQRDPDNYLKEYGVKNYRATPIKTSFDWILEELLEEGYDKQEIANKMIPHIVSEPSAVERGVMCSKLAKLTDIEETDIRSDVRQRANSQVKEISDSLALKLKKAKDAVEARNLIDRAQQQIADANQEVDKTSFHSIKVLDSLESWKEESINPQEGIRGWKTGFKSLDDPLILGGIPIKESIITIPGAPNHGKSSLLINLCKGTVLHEENKNLTNAFHSLDDAVNIFWSKFMASCMRMPILDIRRPDRKILSSPPLKEEYDKWYEWIHEQVKKNRLLVKGHDIGNTIESVENWIKYIQDTTGNNVTLYIDALNDMATGNSKFDGDERVKFIRIYEWLQRVTEELEFSVVTCAHITKNGMSKERPEQSDLSETGKSIYSSKLIGIAYSKLDHFSSKHMRDRCDMYWIDETSEMADQRKPIVEFDITKCKETSFKGTIYFKHDNDCAYMEEISQASVKQIKLFNAEQSNRELETHTDNIDNIVDIATVGENLRANLENERTTSAMFSDDDIINPTG